MNEKEAKVLIDKVIGQIFGYANPYSVEQVRQKFAFDIKLPQKVTDATTQEDTWAQSTNPTKFITIENARKRTDDWMQPKREIKSLEDILEAWNSVNYTSTERQVESINVGQSDNIYNCENVFRSTDSHLCKNIAFCDSVHKSEYVVASQRSVNCVYCMRVEDSKDCTNSFGISWSGKVANSFLIHDSYDVSDCIFCSHIASKRFCIANMQFEEEEYNLYKDKIIKWILS